MFHLLPVSVPSSTNYIPSSKYICLGISYEPRLTFKDADVAESFTEEDGLEQLNRIHLN